MFVFIYYIDLLFGFWLLGCVDFVVDVLWLFFCGLIDMVLFMLALPWLLLVLL